jgi:2-polyprenyl-3-methyl-5-hydroxy-6-metoxy-1,4-benzoquinol methylase
LIKKFKSDLVISSATIEHVGDFQNQVTKVKNMISLSKKYIVLSTPNRFYPIEFHTKLPFLHWLPANIFRKTLLFLNMKYFADEKNLNLLSKSDLKKILNIFSDKIEYKIYNISFLGFVSNFLVICKIKEN